MVRQFFGIALIAVLLILSRESLLRAEEAELAPLAIKVKAILEDRCATCHANGSTEGSIDYILNRNRIVERNLVVLRNSAGSKLFRQLKTGAMPKDEDPLPADEMALIKEWIDSGAPDWDAPLVRETISPDDMLAFMAKDLEAIESRNSRDLPFIRYFSITHLYNAGYSDGELQTYRLALNKLINSLSWGAKIVNPEPIDSAKTIVRIDLRNYKWTTATWERILTINPYGINYDTPAAQFCYEKTQSSLPHVRGDWFVAKASIPPLYHDILDIPSTDRELEKRLNIDVAQNLATDQVARAGFNGSGVSTNNRLIERHVSDLTQGAYWKSYDFKPLLEKQPNGTFQNQSQRNLFIRPLGPKNVMPKVRLPFEHAGGELIWNLPNGLQAYMLVDDKGNRIDVGPVDIVSDPARPDRLVINGLSCMSCHAQGMKDKPDQIRQTVEGNENAYTIPELELVQALYPPVDQFQALLDQDRGRFTRSVELTGGKVGDSDPVVVLAQRFESEVDIKLVSAELGISTAELLAGMDESDELARLLGSLRQPGGTVKRDLLLATFGSVVDLLNLGSYISPLVLPRVPPEMKGIEAGEERELILPNKVKLTLLWCPPGKFTIGSPKSEEDRSGDEAQAEITHRFGFWLGKTEVTQEQWKSLMVSAPWQGEDYVREGGSYPATFVNHNEATEFCRKLTATERALGRLPADWSYALPTEKEWEYACRAESTTRFHFGQDESKLKQYAWFRRGDDAVQERYAHEVGMKRPNAWGFYDLHGNVLEWCRDVYGQRINGGLNSCHVGASPIKVTRGGGWDYPAEDARSARRAGINATIRNNCQGFRLALVYDHAAPHTYSPQQPLPNGNQQGGGGGFF